MIITAPVLTDWFVDRDYSIHIDKAKRNMKLLYQKNFSENDYKYIKNILKSAYKDYEELFKKEYWQMPGIGEYHKEGCGIISLIQLGFKKDLSFEEEIAELEEKIAELEIRKENEEEKIAELEIRKENEKDKVLEKIKEKTRMKKLVNDHKDERGMKIYHKMIENNDKKNTRINELCQEFR